MRRRWWWALGTFLVVLAILVALLRRNAAPPPTQAAPAVALGTGRYGNYAVVLNESGYVGAPTGTTSQLAFPNPGVLERLYVHVGEHVVSGELLAAVDTRPLALDAAQARAEAEAAAAGYGNGSVPNAAFAAARDRARAADDRVDADRSALYRAHLLYAAGVAALKDVQAARATLAADEAAAATARADVRTAGSQPAVVGAQVRAAQARAASADLVLSQGTLTAPTGGYVTAILHHPGEAVDPSKPVVEIGPPQDEVTLSVPGTDATQISIGNPVTLQAAGSTNDSHGSVSAIVPAVDPTTQTATIVVAGRPTGTIAGTAVRARITVAHVRGLLVPQSAIVTDPQRNQDVVFVARRSPDGTTTFVQRVVTIAHEDGTTADIRSGLSPGERVAAQGAFELLAPLGN
jgi:membrane fusion protein (multidrug efflux system)